MPENSETPNRLQRIKNFVLTPKGAVITLATSLALLGGVAMTIQNKFGNEPDLPKLTLTEQQQRIDNADNAITSRQIEGISEKSLNPEQKAMLKEIITNFNQKFTLWSIKSVEFDESKSNDGVIITLHRLAPVEAVTALKADSTLTELKYSNGDQPRIDQDRAIEDKLIGELFEGNQIYSRLPIQPDDRDGDQIRELQFKDFKTLDDALTPKKTTKPISG